MSTNILSFTWTGAIDVVRYEYKFNYENWTEILVGENLVFTGQPIIGDNVFKVRAYDVVGNVSDESISVVNVLNTALPKPQINPVSSPTTKNLIRFSWTTLGSFSSYNFRFNTTTWTSLASDQTEFIGTSQQGLNYFEIRTVDELEKHLKFQEWKYLLTHYLHHHQNWLINHQLQLIVKLHFHGSLIQA